MTRAGFSIAHRGGFVRHHFETASRAGNAKRDPDMRDLGTAEKVGGKVQRKVGEIKKVLGK
jgi:hypothetical protein